jgi:hypothetical protein
VPHWNSSNLSSNDYAYIWTILGYRWFNDCVVCWCEPTSKSEIIISSVLQCGAQVYKVNQDVKLFTIVWIPILNFENVLIN